MKNSLRSIAIIAHPTTPKPRRHGKGWPARLASIKRRRFSLCQISWRGFTFSAIEPAAEIILGPDGRDLSLGMRPGPQYPAHLRRHHAAALGGRDADASGIPDGCARNGAVAPCSTDASGNIGYDPA